VSRVSSSRQLASCHRAGTCTHFLVINPFLPLGLEMETSVQIGGLPACVLTRADKRRNCNACCRLFVVTAGVHGALEPG